MFPNYCIIELQYKPFMWHRADVRLWRVFVSYIKYKPFRWCRSDVRLWHVRLLFSVISPLCDVAQTSDCGIIIILAVSSRGVIQTLVWHQYYYYSCIFLSRSHSDPRLAPVLLFCSFRSRRHSDPRLAPSIYYLYVWSHWLTVHVLHVYICYTLCPNCLASTFVVLTWLVVLARCWRRRSLGWRVW